jgi:hypothetical protein
VETFKLSTDPAFVEKVRDVVGLYLNRPDRALVLCVDEKPQIQPAQLGAGSIPARAAVRRLRRGPAADGTILPMRPGQPPSARPMTIGATAPLTCSPLWTSGPAPSSAAASASTGASSSARSST